MRQGAVRVGWRRSIWASNSGVQSAVIEHWDGTSWSLVPTPSGTATPQALSSVAALSPTDAWALGFQPGTSNPAFQHWDGTAWSNVAVSGVSGVVFGLAGAPTSTLLALGNASAFLSTNG